MFKLAYLILLGFLSQVQGQVNSFYSTPTSQISHRYKTKLYDLVFYNDDTLANITGTEFILGKSPSDPIGEIAQVFIRLTNLTVKKLQIASVDSGAIPRKVNFLTQYKIHKSGEVIAQGWARVYRKTGQAESEKRIIDQLWILPYQSQYLVFYLKSSSLKAEYAIKQKISLPSKFPELGTISFGSKKTKSNYEAKLQITINNSGYSGTSVELTLDAEEDNLEISYDPDYNSSNRWKKTGQRSYELETYVNGLSTVLVKWNEKVNN